MKIFFDTEFTGLHKETQLISIGLIDENGDTFYAEFNDYDLDNATDDDKEWLSENVISKLDFNEFNKYLERNGDNNYKIKDDSLTIKTFLLQWLSKYDNIKFVSDVNHYDFVLLIDLLWSHAKNIPEHISYACLDIDTIQEFCGIHDLPHNNDNRHNSLSDAEEIRENYRLLKKRIL